MSVHRRAEKLKIFFLRVVGKVGVLDPCVADGVEVIRMTRLVIDEVTLEHSSSLVDFALRFERRLSSWCADDDAVASQINRVSKVRRTRLLQVR